MPKNTNSTVTIERPRTATAVQAPAVTAAGDEDVTLWGAESIGKAIDLNPRQAHHMLIKGGLAPAGAKLIVGKWCVSSRRLKAFIAGEVAS